MALTRRAWCSSATRTQRVKRERCLFTGVWKDGGGLLEAYQAIQGRRVVEPGQFVASFVVTPHPENVTLFVGLYSGALGNR